MIYKRGIKYNIESGKSERRLTMKEYDAIYWRGNPQLANGGYESKIRIRARTKENALKTAKKKEKCVYGTMTFLRLEEVISDGSKK